MGEAKECAQCGALLLSEGAACPLCTRSPSPLPAPDHLAVKEAPKIENLLPARSADPASHPKHRAPSSATPSRLNPYFGDYFLVGKIAQGGMGEVWCARQESLNRRVALKLIKAGRLATVSDVRRFRLEAEAAARLGHPNIVQIYEVGEHEGRHFFSMQLLEGGSLAELIAEGRWKVQGSERRKVQEAIAELIAVVARAVHHAHQRGVLHRDLTPGNILLDEEFKPFVTDFGLAKLLENDARVSVTGEVIGTPNYMAPEQAAGKTHQITTATDVYGLGAVLYELLTGQRPFQGKNSIETLRMVLETDPLPVRRINAEVDPDLETICLECLQKEPARRYPSALHLAEDLGRWQRGETIRVRPAGGWERAKKWVRRHPTTASLSAAVALSLLLGLLAFAWQWKRTWQANRRLDAQVSTLRSMEAERYFAEGKTPQAIRLLAQQMREHPRDDRTARRLWTALARRAWPPPIFSHDTQLSVENVSWIPGQDRLLAVTGFGTMTDLHAVTVLDGTSGRTLAGPKPLGRGDFSFEVSPDGKWLLLPTTKTTEVWDAGSLAPIFSVAAHSSRVAWLGDSERLVLTTSSNAVVVRGVVPGTQHEIRLFPMSNAPSAVAASADGTVFAAGDQSGKVAVWERNGQVAGPPQKLPGAVAQLSLSPGGEMAAARSTNGETILWLVREGRMVSRWDQVKQVLFSPTGKEFLVRWDRTMTLHEASSGNRLFDLAGLSSEREAEFSKDGRWIGGFNDQSNFMWIDVSNGRMVGEPVRIAVDIETVRFSTDARLAALVSGARSIELWSRPGDSIKPEPVIERGPRWVFSADGRWIAAATSDKVVLRRAERPEVMAQQISIPDVRWLKFCTRADTLLVCTASGQVSLIHLLDGRVRGSFQTRTNLTAVGVSPDGRQLATLTSETEFQQWDALLGQPLTPAIHLLLTDLRLPGFYRGVAYSPDGGSVLAVTENSEVHVFTPGSPDLRFLLRCDGPLLEIDLSPDGQRLAVASLANATQVWDLQTGVAVTAPLPNGNAGVASVQFSPDGKRLLTAALDGAARIWEASTGKLLATAADQRVALREARFGPEGRDFATADQRGTVRVWDTATGLPVDEPFFVQSNVFVQIFWAGDTLFAWNKDGRMSKSKIPRVLVPIPTWVPTFAELISGTTTNYSPAKELIALRSLLHSQPSEDTWAALAKRLLGP